MLNQINVRGITQNHICIWILLSGGVIQLIILCEFESISDFLWSPQTNDEIM